MTTRPPFAPEARQAGRRMHETAAELRREVLLAARDRCDAMQDGPAAREQMKRDVLDTPAELLADLLAALTTAPATRADLALPSFPQPERTNP